MVVRFILTMSLLVQLAWSMPCCGLVMLRLNVDRVVCTLPAVAECDESESCCSAQACCVATDDCSEPEPIDREAPPAQPMCIVCLPLDHKKPDSAGVIGLPPFTLLPSALQPAQSFYSSGSVRKSRVTPARWTSSRQRQSLLAVWTI